MLTTNARTRKKTLWKKDKLRIGCWNIMSWYQNDQELLAELKNNGIEICAISETKKKGRGIIQQEEYILVYSGVEKNERAREGVGLVIHEKYRNAIVECKYLNSRILQVTLQISEGMLHIVSVYAPDQNKSQEEKQKFYKELQKIIDTTSKKEYIMILGDLNSRIGNKVNLGITQRFNEEEINENGEMLLQFCAENNLRINNTFYDHDMKYKYTWGNTRDQKSVIDYIITNRLFHPTQILDVRTLNAADVGSDHKLVLGKFRFKIKKYKVQPVWENKFNVELLETESVREMYQNRLKEKTIKNPVKKEGSIEGNWEKIEENIINASMEALGMRKINGAQRRINKTPWFTEEVKELTKKKKEMFLKYKQSKDRNDYEEYKIERNRVNSEIRKIKESYWESYTNNLQHDFYGAQRQVWKSIRNQRREIVEYGNNTKIKNEEWIDYFTHLFEQSLDDNNQMESTQKIIVEVTEEDVINNIRTLKNRKSPGPDKITNEMIKYGGETLHKEIRYLIQQILLESRIPEKWKLGILIPIFKKGDKQKTENYRGINLLNTTLKLTTKIVSQKLSEMIILSDVQQGFRRGRSCTDAIYVIRQITEKSLEYNVPAFYCFVDLNKAFDNIDLKMVLEILEDFNIPNGLISLIKDIYTEFYVKIKINGHILEQRIPVKKGIRQGDSLSPLLFNILMDQILKEVRNSSGYKMGRNEINVVCYADDVVLIGDSEDKLQILLHRLNLSCKKYGMSINGGKTKTLTVSKEPLRCKLQLDNIIIEQVMKINYLGTTISSSGFLESEVREQTNKALKISGCLNDFVWRNKYLRTNTKVRIYKTVIRPIMTYAAETRADTTKTKQLLEKTEMNTLRKIVGKTRWDRVRSKDIREVCNVQRIDEWIVRRREEWRSHVERMGADRLVRRVKDDVPEGRRGQGRPRKRWSDSMSGY